MPWHDVSAAQWPHRLAHLELVTVWRGVDSLAAMLRAYTAPEQPTPAPSWPREASANVELEVVRDALEQDPKVDRVELFDALVDCHRTRHTFSRQLDRIDKRFYRVVGFVYVGNPPWWHSTAWGGDGSHGTGGRRRTTAAVDDLRIDANGDIIPSYAYDAPLVHGDRVRTSWASQPQAPIEAIAAEMKRLGNAPPPSHAPVAHGYAVGDRLRASDGTDYYVTAVEPGRIAVGPRLPKTSEKPQRDPARTMSPQIEREKRRHRWKR